MNIFGFDYKKLYFAQKLSLRKLVITSKNIVYTIKFYLQFLCVAGYLKRSNDKPKLNIHKYTNYNIIEIYINRLSTTTQIFIAMDYLMLMSEKYLQFRKNKSICQGNFSPPRRSNWIHVLRIYFSNYVYLKDMYKNFSKLHRSLH